MKMRSTMRSVAASVCVLALSAFAISGPATAQDYPSKPVTLIIPFGPGGSHDMNARVFTSVIAEYLGQPVVVSLTPGAGGQKGTADAVGAPADGYTLLFTHNFVDQLQPLIENLAYDTNEDLVSVARLNSAPPIYWVRADSPWQTIEEFLEEGRENPGELRFAHSGRWGSAFTGGAMVFVGSDVEVTYLPYKGGGPAKQAVLAGDADMTIGRASTVVSEVEAGQVRVLAVGGSERMDEFPDAPTTDELGFGSENIMHRVILAPADLPEERLDVLRQAFREMQDDPTYKKLMSQLGETTDYLDGPDYEELRKEQADNYLKLVKSLTDN